MFCLLCRTILGSTHEGSCRSSSRLTHCSFRCSSGSTSKSFCQTSSSTPLTLQHTPQPFYPTRALRLCASPRLRRIHAEPRRAGPCCVMPWVSKADGVCVKPVTMFCLTWYKTETHNNYCSSQCNSATRNAIGNNQCRQKIRSMRTVALE